VVDSNTRSFTKSITWRVFAFTLLGLISFATTKDAAAATAITIGYNLIQILTFYLHEKIWHYVPWGRKKGIFIQMTGLSGAGKTTIAQATAKNLTKKGFKVEIIDGDEYRQGLCKDLGFSKEDRNTNIRRLGFVGKVLSRNNVITILAAINPYQDIREELRELGAKVVFIDCPLDKCAERDVKGLYAKAMLPDGNPEKIRNFTGVSDPFQAPKNPDLVLRTSKKTIKQNVAELEKFIISST